MLTMNRLSPSMFVQDVTPDMKFQVQKPYLMYKFRNASTESDEVNGVWFHDEAEQNAVMRAIMFVLKSSKAAARGAGSGSSSDAVPVAPLSGAGSAAAPSVLPAVAALFNLAQASGTSRSGSSASAVPAAAAAAVAPTAIGDVGIMLSRKQLQTVLLDMISNDDAFVAALHAKYLSAITRRAMAE